MEKWRIGQFFHGKRAELINYDFLRLNFNFKTISRTFFVCLLPVRTWKPRGSDEKVFGIFFDESTVSRKSSRLPLLTLRYYKIYIFSFASEFMQRSFFGADSFRFIQILSVLELSESAR